MTTMTKKEWDAAARAACEREMEIARASRAEGASWEEIVSSISLPREPPVDALESAILYGRTKAYLICVKEQRGILA